MNDTAPEPGSEQVFRLIYRSHDLIPDERRKTELGALFSGARSNNKKLPLHRRYLSWQVSGDVSLRPVPHLRCSRPQPGLRGRRTARRLPPTGGSARRAGLMCKPPSEPADCGETMPVVGLDPVL